MIAIADGAVARVERDAPVDFIDRQGFVPSRAHHRSFLLACCASSTIGMGQISLWRNFDPSRVSQADLLS